MYDQNSYRVFLMQLGKMRLLPILNKTQVTLIRIGILNIKIFSLEKTRVSKTPQSVIDLFNTGMNKIITIENVKFNV
jgi:hypothetical protein